MSWDDDLLGPEPDPRFRPEWSPDMLLSANYLGRSFAVRAAEWQDFPAGAPPEAWWELLLGLELAAHQTRRIPHVLAHLAVRLPATAGGGPQLVGEQLRRRGWPAVARAGRAGVELDWELGRWPSVTVVIPSRFNRSMLERSLASLATTDYPDLEVVVVDNSGRTDDKSAWYERWFASLDLRVEWWTDEPFNWSAVNNAGAAVGRGEVLVFLNDDTEARDATWLRHVVGWATRPEIGTVGIQLIDGDGRIQHGGVVLGIDGFAGHLFGGMEPDRDTALGHSSWTRNTLAVTGACVAVERAVFDELGGFDERFVLCGSDVVLGLDAVLSGRRNVCSAGVRVDHLEGATRGDAGVHADLFASWWRYRRWLVAGDPYFSPNLALATGVPECRSPVDPSPLDRIGPVLGRDFGTFRQSMSSDEAFHYARRTRLGDAAVAALAAHHAETVGPAPVHTVNWYLPEFDNPFYGGIATILRIADLLARSHGVEHRIVVIGGTNEEWYRSAVTAAYPSLAEIEFVCLADVSDEELGRIPPADAAIATMWHTAYAVARTTGQRRKFYLVQDFEPCFYPTGTMYALAEETYRLGLYGIANTEPMAEMYEQRYGGRARSFVPAVDRAVFHPPDDGDRRPADDPLRVFLYARPGHWRNCWEIASTALTEIKAAYGTDVHIVTAGSWARPEDLGQGIEHLGLLEVEETGDLYRRCDVGIALTVSEHPSYLPVELMACGVPVVAFDIPEASWILTHEETGLAARRTAEGVREQVARLLDDEALRADCRRGALARIDAHHSDWDRALGGIYDHLCAPE